jgi:parvulin-like peptidyl-prolyl isomerase
MAKRITLPAGRKWRLGLAFLGVAGALGALCWFRSGSAPEAQAQTPNQIRAAQPAPLPQAPPSSSDYKERVVAYIGNEPVTREQLGEYLITRYGAERLELMVNKMIIDRACQERHLDVTAAEVEAELAKNLEGMKINQTEFVNKVLKSYKKNLTEWKEDVIRPKLQLDKMCRNRVKYTEEDVRSAFEAYYGEKVECRIIMWPKEEKQRVLKEYAKYRDSEDEFANAAKHQASSQLAAVGGKLPPIGRNTTGDPEFEKVAFRLQAGEVSEILETQEGVVIVKCDRRIPADTTANPQAVRPVLIKEIIEKKVVQEIPIMFKELRDQAKPKLILQDPHRPEDLAETVKELLPNGGFTNTPRAGMAPHGN